MPSAKLRDINKRWSKGEFINGLDPNFGNESIGDPHDYYTPDWIYGSIYACTESGTATSITAYIAQLSSFLPKFKYALHKLSDLSLVAYTAEGTMTTDFEGWWPLDVVWGGTLEATDYILAPWFDDWMWLYTKYHYQRGRNQNIAYNSFPDPLDPLVAHYDISIFCSYTVAVVAKRMVGNGLTCVVT